MICYSIFDIIINNKKLYHLRINMSESNARIVIDKLLREAGWILHGDDGVVNVDTEKRNRAGFADYLLEDEHHYPLCVIEAKTEILDPLIGKEQARGYAESLNCKFIILSNGVKHYLWDVTQGNPTIIDIFPSPKQLELRRDKFKPARDKTEEINIDYIAKTQIANFQDNPDYIDTSKRDGFIKKNKLRILRYYQLNALKAVQSDITKGKDRFLLEMATGTGKTLTSAAIIKMFFRLYGVNRVLFLVDRIELETQAQKEFHEILKNDYQTVIWKENQSDWQKAQIVISTVQSFVSMNKYRKIFQPDHFDLVISDEAHRSLGAKSRKVFEYFIGFKLGLTATPKDYLKSVDVDDMNNADPWQLEKRMLLDTYITFGCDNSEPTFKYSLQNGVTDGYLINPKVIDARTEITTELLSSKGYIFNAVDEDGNDIEETFSKNAFEKKFFSDNTNMIFCKTFLENAKRDPYTGEIGKTLIFCVSQKHATKITQMLNILADKAFPNQYRSDFAVQVTSNVDNSQNMTVDFRNNKLNGFSSHNPFYRTSKTRVCATVGMMTTGYDCTDILNICMMRPIYSPSEFVQMKGRGTRRYDFTDAWIDKTQIPSDIEPQKQKFILFDFFGNYEYFENDFNYDEVLKLPVPSLQSDEPSEPINIDEAHSYIADPLALLQEIQISNTGMKVDRELYRSFKKKLTTDATIIDLVKKQNFAEAETYLHHNILNKPEEYFTIDKIVKTLQLDRKPTIQEILLHARDDL